MNEPRKDAQPYKPSAGQVARRRGVEVGRFTVRRVPRMCNEAGCPRSGGLVPCYLSGDRYDGHYCSEHAHANGFCHGCGNFWAGVESFDFGNGYCENCRYDFTDDYGEYEWPEEAYAMVQEPPAP